MNRQIVAAAAILCLFWSGSSAAIAAGLTQSASKVGVNAEYAKPAAQDGSRLIRVQLDMADGWHVNAHPASLDFLVATTIHATADNQPLSVQIDWPSGHASGIEFNGTAVQVYGDDTVIPVQLGEQAAKAARTAGHLVLSIRVQACSNRGICLPPSTLSVKLSGQ